MFTRREKQKPFRPSASFKALDVPLQPFTKSDQVDPDDDHRVRRPPSKPDFPMMVDAETGEPVGYTRAKWTAKEGRLSLTARTILDMGTGKLDIKTRCNPRSNDTLDENSTISQHSNINPIVKEFLQNGPLNPMYHKHWNPVTGLIEDPQEKFALLHAGDLPADNDDASGVRTWTSIDESTIMSSPSAYLYSKPAGRKQEESVNKSSSVSVVESVSPSRNAAGAERFPLPIDLELMNAKNWETLFAKTYSDLLELTMELEKNKFLTKQAPYHGGVSAIRRVCKTLATLRVNQMRELVQAIDDEADRDQKRESAERAVFDKPQQLHDLKKQNREQRRIGKQYVESLQRDHEIIFLIKFREAGFLW